MHRFPKRQIRTPPLLRNRATPKPEQKADKLFGRYDDLVRLILGFVLTGVVGGYLTRHYTERQANIDEASKVFNEHSKLIGDRYFTQNRLYLHFRQIDVTQVQSDPEQEKIRLAAYQESLMQWNSERGFNREMIDMYFGGKYWTKERNIHYMMRGWGNTIEARLRKEGSIDYGCMTNKLDKLLDAKHELRVTMAQALQQGKIAQSKESTPKLREVHEEYPCFSKHTK